MKRINLKEMSNLSGGRGACTDYGLGILLMAVPGFSLVGGIYAIKSASKCGRALERRYGCLGWC